jgi:hypothetical protein
VDNTLVPYDAAFDELQEAEELGWLVQAVHPDAKFRDDATAMVTKVDGGQTVLALNAGVYKAMAAINLSKFDAATQYYVKRQLLEFRLAGVDKDGATRTQLMTLKKRLSEAQARFERNIADGDRAVEVRDVAELDGLPVDYIASHKADAQGVIHLTTRSADVAPVLKSAKSDALRKRMFEASGENAYPENDAVLREMMNTRSEIARLVGYTSWSDLNAQDKMIGSSKDTAAFIAELDRTARPAAQREFAMLLAEKRKTDPGATQIEQYQVAQLLDRVVGAGVLSVRAGERWAACDRRETLPPGLSPGEERSGVGPGGRDVGRAGRWQSGRSVLPGFASEAGEGEPWCDVHNRYGPCGTETAGGGTGVQLAAANGDRSRAYAVCGCSGVFPRIWAPDASHPGG